MKKILFIIYACLFTLYSHAQDDITMPSNDSIVVSDSIRKLSLPLFTLRHIDFDSLLAESSENTTGYWVDIKQNFKALASLCILPDSSRMWRLEIHKNSPLTCRLVITNLNLKDDAELWFYNKLQTTKYGPYFGDTKEIQGHDIFQVPDFDDDFVIEYYEPSDNENCDFFLNRAKLIQTEDNKTGEKSLSSLCFANSTCYPDWANESKSVVNIEIETDLGRIRHGSGVMINPFTNGDNTLYRPLLLTAFHNLDTKNDIDDKVLEASEVDDLTSQTTFTFNDDRNCTNGNNNPYKEAVWHAKLLWASCFTDLAVIELLQLPIHPSKVYLAGFDASINIPSSGVTIHHPNGDTKQISFENNTFLSTPGNNCNLTFSPPAIPLQPDAFWVLGLDPTADNKGLVIGGSSGAPLFGNGRRVVGTLTGPLDQPDPTCNNMSTPMYFGRLSHAFEMTGDCGTEASKTLEDILVCPGCTTDKTTDGQFLSEITCYDDKTNAGETNKNCGGDCPDCPEVDRWCIGEDNLLVRDCSLCDSDREFWGRQFRHNGVKSAKNSISFYGHQGTGTGTTGFLLCRVMPWVTDLTFIAGESVNEEHLVKDGIVTTIIEPCEKCGCAWHNGNGDDSRIAQHNSSSLNSIESIALQEKEKPLNTLTIRPNPANSTITLTIPSKENANVIFTDMIGQIVMQEQTNTQSTEFNIAHLPKGIYFVTAKTATQQFVSKLVKE